MTSNESLLAKADIAVSDLNSNGGLLNPEQSNTFVRKLLKQPSIINLARVVEMASPTRNVDKIQFASRILRPGTSGTALSAGDRSAPTTEQISLTSKEVIAQVNLPYDVIEDNIERGNIGQQMPENGGTSAGGGFVDTILDLIAERYVLDLEELAIRGDDTSTDDYLALTDGWLVTTEDGGNVVDGLGGSVTKTLWKKGLKTLPDQYHRNRTALRHFVSLDQEIEYRDTLANRATGLGDASIQQNPPIFGFGVPVAAVSQMPDDRGLLTNPLNLLFGIQRRMHMEVAKDITARVYEIVVTARIDFQVEETDASVYYSNLGTAL